MKKILTALAAAIFLLLPARAFSAYIIHLKHLGTCHPFCPTGCLPPGTALPSVCNTP